MREPHDVYTDHGLSMFIAQCGQCLHDDQPIGRVAVMVSDVEFSVRQHRLRFPGPTSKVIAHHIPHNRKQPGTRGGTLGVEALSRSPRPQKYVLNAFLGAFTVTKSVKGKAE